MAFRLRRAQLALALLTSATACATAMNDDTTETAGAAGMPSAGAAGNVAGNGGSSGGAQAGAPSGGTSGSPGGGAGGTIAGAGGASGGTAGAPAGGTAGKAGAGGGGASAGSGGTAGKGGGGAGGGGAGGGSAGSPAAGAGGGNGCTVATATLNSIYDAELNAQLPTANAAYVAEVRIVRGGPAGSHRAVFWFDFGQVPAGKTLKSATLQLTVANNPGLSKNLAVHRISQAANRKWEEPQVTWNEFKNANAWSTPGGDFVATATDTKAIQDNTLSGTTLSYNVLADAQSFYSMPATNYGWLIKDPLDSTNPSGESVYIATRENTTIAKPVVVVTYCP